MVTSSPAFISSLNTRNSSINSMIWRRVFTKVPCRKLMLLIFLTLVSSSPKILKVLRFSLATSCSVSPKLFTNSILRSDSVVAPASAVVCATIFF